MSASVKPQLDRRTEEAVLAILHSGKVNYWTGPVGMEFERAFAKCFGFRNAVSVLSGFAARRVAYFALGLDPDGDEVKVKGKGEHRRDKSSIVHLHLSPSPDCSHHPRVAYFTFGVGEPITAGGQGGMVCTDDDDLAWEMRSIRDHGYDARSRMQTLGAKTQKRRNAETQTPINPYVHRRLGYNFRLTEIQSAIGLCELRRLRVSS